MCHLGMVTKLEISFSWHNQINLVLEYSYIIREMAKVLPSSLGSISFVCDPFQKIRFNFI